VDSGALKTSRNPHSGKRRRRRSGEEEEELEAHQVREDSVPLPIKEVLEVCLVNRRVRWLEGLDSSNKPEVASWVDSGSRNNKPGVCRRERSQTRVASGIKASVNLDKDVITSTCARRAAARRTGR